MRWRLSQGAGGAGSDSPHLSVGMGHSGQSTRRGPHRRAPVCFCCVILSPWSRVCVGRVSPLELRPWDAECVHCCTAGACRLRAGKWRCCVDAWGLDSAALTLPLVSLLMQVTWPVSAVGDGGKTAADSKMRVTNALAMRTQDHSVLARILPRNTECDAVNTCLLIGQMYARAVSVSPVLRISERAAWCQNAIKSAWGMHQISLNPCLHGVNTRSTACSDRKIPHYGSLRSSVSL